MWPRAPDKVHIFIATMPHSSQNPMYDLVLELYHRDNSNKWSNIGFGDEITQVVSIKVNFYTSDQVLCIPIHQHC